MSLELLVETARLMSFIDHHNNHLHIKHYDCCHKLPHTFHHATKVACHSNHHHHKSLHNHNHQMGCKNTAEATQNFILQIITVITITIFTITIIRWIAITQRITYHVHILQIITVITITIFTITIIRWVAKTQRKQPWLDWQQG